uniref:VWFA domain-containing protein n=1 Tax=Leptobrachium leishanense TaxID=445787 RepID=A0A8C5R717_9ANUR
MALSNLFVVFLAFQALGKGRCSMVKLNNGGYEDIVIAINPAVPEDPKIIENVQNMVKDATSYLFHATKKRLYIRNVKILIPLSWSPNTNYIKSKTETYDKADVIIDTPHIYYGDDPYTLQYGRCGEPGRYIHFTPNFLLDDSLLSAYGDRGRVFVHEWAHFRWGVFDEYDSENPFYDSGFKVEATRCSADIIGYNYIPCTGLNCTPRPCNINYITGLLEDGCVFIPDKNQFATESIMYMQVSEFCDASNHNIEAPTLQNHVCNSRSTWDVISDSSDIKSTVPGTTITIPEPTFSLLQPKNRVLTLVLDVSKNTNNRLGRLYQAAEVFLIQIIELGSYVGIVTFSSSASIRSQLLQIHGDAQRQTLKSLLPSTASGGSNICAGILAGIEVNKGFDGSAHGTEIILIVTGEDDYDTKLCYPDIINSGVIIHTGAVGPEAAKELEEIAYMTGGITFIVSDRLDVNGLIDAFIGLSLGNRDLTHEALVLLLQLESNSLTLSLGQCLSDTVFIDSTVGNSTFFLVTWQTAVPAITLEDPNGNVYNVAHFTSDSTAKSSRLEIPGTAEVRGTWNYDLCNPLTESQVVGMVVSSTAADPSVPPITVTAHMNTDTNEFPNPMIVYAFVSQGQFPVTGVIVTAIIEPQTGSPEIIQLLDNGAGSDVIKNDGVYSRYFFGFKANGGHSLKVRVQSKGTARLTLPRNRALYVPGYVENGEVVMYPPRPSITEGDLRINVGPISRTASGSSFVLSNVPDEVQPDLYKPEKITDLKAKIEEMAIVLTWTATGDDLDHGIAAEYDLRMSTNPAELRDYFEECKSIDISHSPPQPAGSSETFAFVPEDTTLANGTIIYFSLVAIDKVSHKSDVSNIAQTVLFISPTLPPTTTITPPSTPPLTTTTPPLSTATATPTTTSIPPTTSTINKLLLGLSNFLVFPVFFCVAHMGLYSTLIDKITTGDVTHNGLYYILNANCSVWICTLG